MNEFWTFFFSWHFSFKVSESISTQKIKKAKQVRRLLNPAAILCKGQALRVFGKNFENIIKKFSSLFVILGSRTSAKNFFQKTLTQFPASFKSAFFSSFFSVFSSFSFKNILAEYQFLNPELCSISKYARTTPKKERPKIQFSFYQEEKMQGSHCLNLAQIVLSYIAGTKPKKKTCTGYFTPFGKTDFFIRISVEV